MNLLQLSFVLSLCALACTIGSQSRAEEVLGFQFTSLFCKFPNTDTAIQLTVVEDGSSVELLGEFEIIEHRDMGDLILIWSRKEDALFRFDSSGKLLGFFEDMPAVANCEENTSALVPLLEKGLEFWQSKESGALRVEIETIKNLEKANALLSATRRVVEKQKIDLAVSAQRAKALDLQNGLLRQQTEEKNLDLTRLKSCISSLKKEILSLQTALHQTISAEKSRQELDRQSRLFETETILSKNCEIN